MLTKQKKCTLLVGEVERIKGLFSWFHLFNTTFSYLNIYVARRQDHFNFLETSWRRIYSFGDTKDHFLLKGLKASTFMSFNP